MENENEIFRSFFSDIWKLVMASKDSTRTEKEWEKLIENGNTIVNDPKYGMLQDLPIIWINGFISWLEERNRKQGP